ncbi:MAG: hypothetical protein IKP02_00755 [Paludibacteraceae bacterium]|nr:hypothetical protein [Paludibacteraceae bacterium]
MKAHQIKTEELKNAIERFHKQTKAEQRYASYDFCYGYFQTHRDNLLDNLELSCLHLWGYLASWGMLRGSSELLQCSPAALKNLITYFDSIRNSSIWDIDVDVYPQNLDIILNVYADISKILEDRLYVTPSKTLVTKIMLGVFGCIPAFDTYFTDTFHKLYKGFYKCEKKELCYIEDFYRKHQYIIDNMNIPVIDFNGRMTEIKYTKAKLIDMFGFTIGYEAAKKNNAK